MLMGSSLRLLSAVMRGLCALRMAHGGWVPVCTHYDWLFAPL